MQGGLLQFIDVHHAFGKHILFQGMNLSFDLGKIIGIVGMNGSGKSTLLRIFSGICEPHQGEVRFLEQNLYRSHSLKSSIGYVPSTPILFPFLTLKENFKWLLRSKKIQTEKLHDVLTEFELTEYQNVLFAKLSDGLKKRACLASQWLHSPDLLILDEPCAMLDPMQREILWKRIENYRAPNRLIIISSHHPDEIALFCDNMFLLSQGKLLNYPHTNFAKTLWNSIQPTALKEDALL